MSYMQQTTVRLIRQTQADRSYVDIQFVLPWLRKKGQLLHGLDQGVLTELIKGCGYQHCSKNDVVVAQGDVGDCMFIILDGRCDVYIDAAKSGEEELVSTTASDLMSSVYKASSSGASHAPTRASRTVRPPEDAGKKTEKGRKTPNAKKPEVPLEEEAPDSADALMNDTEQTVMEQPSETIDDMLAERENRKTEKRLNKLKYGRYIMTFNEGSCFGELALMSEDSIRNATVIADGEADLLVISRDLYNHTLKAYQEKEYEQKREFVSKHPLFSGWLSRFRRLLEMSLIKEIYPVGAPIIAQGEPTNGISFILSGQAKVITEPSRHLQQYKKMTPFIVDDVSEGLNWIRGSKTAPKRKQTEEMTVRKRSVEIRRKKGYAAVEKLQSTKVIPLSLVGPGEIIGEVEAVANLKTYMQSVSAVDKVEAFILNAKNFERLVVQKNQKTMDLLKMLAETKLNNRLQHVTVSQVPLFRHLLYNMRRVERPKSQEKEVELVPSKSLPDRDTLFKHMTACYIKNRAELIEPIVPGSLYIREVMRERARIRENLRPVKKQPTYLNRQRATKHRRVEYPRSNQQLKLDLERQKNTRENQERLMLVKNIRKLEMTDVRDELEDFRLKGLNLPSISILQRLKPDDRRRVHHILTHELRLALPSDQSPSSVLSTDISHKTSGTARVGKRKKVKKDNKRSKGKNNNAAKRQEKVRDDDRNTETADISADVMKYQFERTYTTHMRAGSEPDLSRDPTRVNFDVNGGKQNSGERMSSKYESSDCKVRGVIGNRLSRPQSAKADVTDVPENYILPRAAIIPPIAKADTDPTERRKQKKQRLNLQESRRRSAQTKVRFMDDTIRQELKMAAENPEYRDWETGESSVAYLESRINKFNHKQSEYMENPTPVVLPQLHRFHANDEKPKQPLAGGRVYVQKQECPMSSTEYHILDHRHTRFHMVPELPDYENLRRSRMLMQLVLDDVRTNATGQ